MSMFYLAVHPVSYGFVTGAADYVLQQLRMYAPDKVEFVICEDVGAIDFQPGSAI
jgi:hypothetical protein